MIKDTGEHLPPLNEFTKEEWRDVSRACRPDWTEEQFEEYWVDFVQMKKLKALN